MKKHLLLLTITFFLSLTHSLAQTPDWQWGKRGGTPVDEIGYGALEDVEYITVDKWGNLYFVSNVCNLDINIDGHVYPTTGDMHAEEICIASYTCDGTMRWYKMVYGLENEAVAIKTDTFGGVYVAGRIIVVTGSSPGFCAIGDSAHTDTTFGPSPKSMFLMKLDTAGAYKWLTMPEPDSLPITGDASGIYDMDVDDDGNCYLFCSLKAGAYANGTFVATDSPIYNFWSDEPAYILQYDKNGAFKNGHHLPMWHHSGNYPGETVFLTRDSKHHRTYVTGGGATTAGDSFFVAGNFVAPMYLACFDDSCNLRWIKTGSVGAPSDRPAVDDAGNVYLTGGCTDSTQFNGHIFSGMGGLAPYVVKSDTDGTNIWAINGVTPADIAWGSGITVTNNIVGVFGEYSTPFLAWGTDTLSSAVYTPFIARFDALTGVELTLKALNGLGYTMPGNGGGFALGTTGTLAADQYGNLYVGGNFQSEVFIPADTLVSYGGETDWFIAKFGTDVCTPAPLGVKPAVVKEACSLFPNPNTGSFTVSWHLASGNAFFRLVDMTGREVYTQAITKAEGSQEISLSDISSGMYFHSLTTNEKTLNGKVLVIK